MVRAVLVVLLLSAPARAEEGDVDRAAFGSRPTAVSLFAGSAAPFGAVGVQAEYAPVPLFAIFGGIVQGRDHLQAGAGARVQLPLINAGRGYAPGVSFSMSRGRSPSALDRDAESLPSGAWWMNLEGSIERRADSGFLLRAVLGYGLIVDPTQLPPSRVNATRSPYFALHAGWSF
jgi:hypothetical protein